MIEIFILAGPTGIGKTEISIELAKRLNGEIISADSMQIYKYMDIGSAKVTRDEMNGVPHHLIDFVDPHECFSVSMYKSLAEEKIKEISSRGKLPMIVGGTGLYINSVIYDYDFNMAFKDEDYRNKLQDLAIENGKEYVHSLLKDIDLVSFNKLYPNDLKRVIRALEVYKLTGKTLSEINMEREKLSSKYKLNYFVLNLNRDELYERINKRVDIMLQKGLVDEVKKLLSMGLDSSMQSMKGIGYKEIIYYLEGKYTYEEAVDAIKQGSRNYAKRQLTWFRREKNAKFIEKDNFSDNYKIIDEIYGKMEGF